MVSFCLYLASAISRFLTRQESDVLLKYVTPFVFIFIGAFTIGCVVSDLAIGKDLKNIAVWRHHSEKPLALCGVVKTVEEDGLILKIAVEKVSKCDALKTKFPGLVELKAPVSEDVKIRDSIQFFGKIKIPETDSFGIGHFDPKRYYSRRGIFATIDNPKLKIIENGKFGWLSTVRMFLRSRIQKILPEPSAGLFAATFLGYSRDVPKELRNQFSTSGLAHLVAISGQHVAMLAILIFWIVISLGFSRKFAMFSTAFASLIFITLVDFPPSGIRSIIMLVAVYFAYVSGRKTQGARVLLLTVAIMLMINPRVLLADLGFQLSVLAMWGLIVFYPVLIRKLSGMEKFGFFNVVIMTFCAVLMTTPIIGYAFGRISFIGLISNVIAAPLYTAIMLIGFLVMVFGWVPFLGDILVYSAHALTSLFFGVVNFSSRLPGGEVAVSYFDEKIVVICYALFFLISLVISSETRKQFWPIVCAEKNSARKNEEKENGIIVYKKSVQDEHLITK